MTAGESEDMTACFGAWNVKTAPKRAFSACPERPGRVASGYCVSAGLKGEVEGKLLQWILFSYQHGKKISNCGGENDPRGREPQRARNPLS